MSTKVHPIFKIKAGAGSQKMSFDLADVQRILFSDNTLTIFFKNSDMAWTVSGGTEIEKCFNQLDENWCKWKIENA
jgi:hypothetical protein